MKTKGRCTSCLRIALLGHNKCSRCKPTKTEQVDLLMQDVRQLKDKLTAAQKTIGSIKYSAKPKGLIVLQEKNRMLNSTIRKMKKELKKCNCKCQSHHQQTIFLDPPVEVRYTDLESI